MKKTQTSNERAFSIELNSKISLKNISLCNGSHQRVVLEGTIGELEYAGFTECTILEIVGKKGVLRVDLTQNELEMPKKEVISNEQ